MQDGEIKTVHYRGAWVLVDNGYLNWAVTVPPLKNPVAPLFVTSVYLQDAK